MAEIQTDWQFHPPVGTVGFCRRFALATPNAQPLCQVNKGAQPADSYTGVRPWTLTTELLKSFFNPWVNLNDEDALESFWDGAIARSRVGDGGSIQNGFRLYLVRVYLNSTFS